MMIRFNNAQDWYPTFINTAYIASMDLYHNGSRKHGNQTWHISITLSNGECFIEDQEDTHQQPLPEEKARDRFRYLLIQCGMNPVDVDTQMAQDNISEEDEGCELGDWIVEHS